MYEYNLVELARKLSNIIKPGTVQEADYKKARLKVKAGELLTAWLPWLTTRAGNNKTWWAPEVGEQVLLLCPDGNPAQAWILPAGFTQDHAAPETKPECTVMQFKDGASIRYDTKAHKLDIILPADGAFTIDSPAGVIIKKDLTVKGNIKTQGNVKTTGDIETKGSVKASGDIGTQGSIKASGDITDSTRSMSADRLIFNTHTHPANGAPPATQQ
ncbi:MAG: phage baseplate assembly protein V [Flavobacteriales bacterium]